MTPPRSVTLTRTNGHPLAGLVTADPTAAWSWVASVVARNFNCLPDDVDYDEGGFVTVNGEAVAVLMLTIH